jgi:hypothetical protein
LIPFGYLSIFNSSVSEFIIDRSYELAGWMVAVISYLFLAYVLVDEFLDSTKRTKSFLLRIGATVIVLALMLAAPINIFTIGERRLYLGYIGINVYHNPTILLLKPLALLLFWNITRKTDDKRTTKDIIIVLILMTLTTMAKPSYTICLLPAIFIWSGFKIYKKQFIDFRFLAIGVIMPALVVLTLQYLVTYSGGESAAISLAPLKAMLVFVRSAPMIIMMLILSILFPLSAILLFPELLSSDQRLVLAWFAFLAGIFFTYFLSETGERTSHGNFFWSGQITLFILFVQTTFSLLVYALRKGFYEIVREPRFVVCMVVFGFHMLSGVLWYLAEVIQPHQWWWKGFNY